MKLLKSVAFLICIVLFCSCVKERRTIFYQVNRQGTVTQKTIDLALWENALPADQEISSTKLLTGDFASYHLVQVRTREKPHRHDYHDLAVFIHSGSGVMFTGKDVTELSEGAVVFIPRGMVHFFVNSGQTPSVAIAVFSPPYDGKDDIPVEDPAKSVVP